MIHLNSPLIYITRDIERTLGLSLDTPHYYIITNATTYANKLAKEHNNIILIQAENQLDTWELLEHDTTIQKINELSANIIVFKNTSKIERICTKNNWHLLNPSAELSNKVEEKISQIDWLDHLAEDYLPPYSIEEVQDVFFQNKPFILQYNRAHTGTGTILIENQKQLDDIKNTFPNRDVRITDFIEGPMFTSNNIVTPDTTIMGNISYQITGIEPFTDQRFATVGNDWKLPHDILTDEQKKQYKHMVDVIGDKLRIDGWKGLFGIDIIMDEKTGALYLIEINCRQPASTTYESILQQHATLPYDASHKTTYEAHILALLDKPVQDIIHIDDGAQIIQRVTKFVSELPEPICYTPASFDYIHYDNTKPGNDLLRMMTKNSVMEKHGILNDEGNMLMDFIFVTKYKNSWNVPRGAAIIIKDEKILLIKRHKLSRDYYIVPGGTMEDDETIEQTMLREIREETSLEVKSTEDTFMIMNRGRESHYFFVDIISGEAQLSGPECKNNTIKNNYALEWIPLFQLSEINLVPGKLKEKLITKYLK